MRLKIERFLPFSILSLTVLAQPAFALSFAKTMNDVLLGLFGLERAPFATEAGQAAWIFVFCAFAIIYGIVFSVSHYLPFFREQGNRGARILFSAGLGIASLIYPDYINFLWGFGFFFTVLILIIVLVGLVWSSYLGARAGSAAATADTAEQQARGAEAGLRSTQATQTGRTVTAQANTVVAQQRTERNLQPARQTREQNRLTAETTQQNAQVQAIVNQTNEGLTQLQRENTRRQNQINAEADQQNLNRDERQQRLNQAQETFDQTLQERLDEATRRANETLVRQAREENWDNERLRAERARVTDQIAQAAQRMRETQATTDTGVLRQQTTQAEVQRQLDAQQRLLALEQQSFARLVQHVAASVNSGAGIVDKLREIRRALQIAGGVSDTRTAMRLIGPLAGEAGNLQQFTTASAQLLSQLDQTESQITNLLPTATTRSGATLSPAQTAQITTLRTEVLRLRGLAQTQIGDMQNQCRTYLDEIDQLTQLIDSGNPANATQLVGRLETQALELYSRSAAIQNIVRQTNSARRDVASLLNQIRNTP